MAAQHISACYAMHCEFFHNKNMSSYNQTFFHQVVQEYHGEYYLVGDRRIGVADRIMTCDDSLRILRCLTNSAKYKNTYIQYKSTPGSPLWFDPIPQDQPASSNTIGSPGLSHDLFAKWSAALISNMLVA
jgi:hypothetical protein